MQYVRKQILTLYHLAGLMAYYGISNTIVLEIP